MGEDTSVIIKEDVMTVYASGLLMIVDGTEIEFTGHTGGRNRDPIAVEE